MRIVLNHRNAFLFPLLLLITGVYTLRAEWGVQTIPEGYVTDFNLQLDSLDRPYVVYHNTNEHMTYAHWTGTSWDIKDIGISINSVPELAIDSAYRPHIAYTYYADNTLKYGVWNGVSWDIQTVVTLNDGIGIYCSIALDASDNPYIVYCERQNYHYLLKCAKWTGTAWDIQTIDENVGGYGERSYIRIGEDGYPQVAYFCDISMGRRPLKYARWNGSAWVIQTVDDQTEFSRNFPCLAIDSDNNPHISFIGNSSADDSDIAYARWNGSSWEVEAVATEGRSGYENSLGLDSNNVPHLCYVSYNDEPLPQIIYAVKRAGTWQKTVLETGGGQYREDGRYNSLALDSHNNPHIVYKVDFVGFRYVSWNNAPVLSWQGEAGYIADGLDKENGIGSVTCTYKVKYTDSDNDPPAAGYPKLRIKKDGMDISGGPFTMDAENTDGYTTGRNYAYSVSLSTGNYRYSFEAFDIWNTTATSISGSGPDISSAPEVTDKVPEDLAYVYPNPAKSGGITFRFTCYYGDPEIEITVYDMSGEVIRKISDDKISKALVPIIRYAWDCRNDESERIASGIYIYIIKARDKNTGEETKITKKLAILK